MAKEISNSAYQWGHFGVIIFEVIVSAIIIYLAYRMIGSLKDYKKDTGRPLNIYEAALFQWVNPKAWTIAITVASGFMPLEEKLWIAVVFTGLMSSLVSFPCISLWALFGSLIKNLVSNPKLKRSFEYFFALLLVSTGIYLILN